MTIRGVGRLMWKAVTPAFASGLLVWSCSDLHVIPRSTIGSDPADPAIATPSLARDIQPIFSARCAIPGCHITATQANLGLVLTDPVVSHDHLVNVVSGEFPPVLLVMPGSSANSYLIFKLQVDDPQQKMPKSGPALSPGTIATIAAWIDQGAQQN